MEARQQLDEAMARLARGDRAAFETVYRGVYGVVRAFTGKLLSDADADDAAQQTLIKLFAQASDYEIGRDVVSWALSIAIWECRTVRRRQMRRREAGEVPDTLDAAASPEDAVMRREAEAAWLDVVGRLSPTDREALEVALEAGNDGSAAFRKRKQRAIERLRKLWRSVYGTE